MKRFFSVLPLIVIVFLACNAQKQFKNVEWKEFISNEGNFKIFFPSEPRHKTKENTQTPSKIISHWFEVELPKKAFLLSYADYPIQQSLSEDQIKVHYNFLRDNTIKIMDAKLVTEKDVILDKYLGREIVLKTGNTLVVHRYYMIEKRFFQQTYSIESVGNETEESKDERNKFFESFQLLKK